MITLVHWRMDWTDARSSVTHQVFDDDGDDDDDDDDDGGGGIGVAFDDDDGHPGPLEDGLD